MAQRLTVLAALLENPGSIPNTHLAAQNYNSSSRGSDTITTDIHASKTPVHIRYKLISFKKVYSEKKKKSSSNVLEYSGNKCYKYIDQ